MLPRWVIITAIVFAVIWVINDPAGAGQFCNHVGHSVTTFFKNLG